MTAISTLNEFRKLKKKVKPIFENDSGILEGGFFDFTKSRPSSLNNEISGVQESAQNDRMKASRFNSFIAYDQQLLAFNAYTQKFLILDSELLDLFNAALIENDFEGLSEIHPQFFDTLINRGFLVKEETDELQKLIRLREKVDFANDFYHLTINPTMNCNFKCWYCYESHVKGSQMTNETIEKVIKYIKHVISTNDEIKQFRISWFGGEPMLYFDKVIKPITEETHQIANQRGIAFSSKFTTNGYLIKPRMIPFFKKYNISGFQITLDGHRDRHNKVRYTARQKGTYDEIIESIKLLARNQVYVAVRINYVKDTLEKIQELINDFKDLSATARSYLNFNFHNVWQEGEANQEKLSEVITDFRNNDFVTESLFSSVDTLRDSCYADKRNHATINYNGEVFKCTARDFKSDNREGILTDSGRIEWNETFEKRMNIKFKNSPCLSCRIQPLCNGGCSQKGLESMGEEYCVVEDAGISKDDIIMSRFEQNLERRALLKKRIKNINRDLY